MYKKPEATPETKTAGEKNDSDANLPVVREYYLECNADGHMTSLITDGGEKFTVDYLRDVIILYYKNRQFCR